MTKEKARELYWKAVHALNEVIDAGAESREDILDELGDDLNGGG